MPPSIARHSDVLDTKLVGPARGRHCRQPIKLAVGPTELEGDILALGETVFSQAPAEAFHQIGIGARRSPTHEPDHWHRRRLPRARRERRFMCGWPPPCK